jgi:hypothetical protein
VTTYTSETYANGALTQRQVVDTVASTLTVFDGAGVQQSQRALTAGEVAQYAATGASVTASLNNGAVTAALTTRLGQIEAYIAANPTGSVLTPAQTLIVAKMLAGLTRLALQALSTAGQAG